MTAREDMGPTISVIMNAYNAERHIGEAVGCILRQDFPDFELIVVDDGSTDRTSLILQGFSKQDTRVKVYRQDNAGSGVSRDVGFSHANGTYVAFLDSDDIFQPDMLSKLYAASSEGQADIVVCNAVAFHDATNEDLYAIDGHRGLKQGTYKTRDLESQLFQIFWSNPWGKIIKADLLRKHSLTFQSLPRSNEVRCIYSAFALSDSINVIDDVLVRYRVGAGSSLLDKAAQAPLCDLVAYDALRDSLQRRGKLSGEREGLLRSLDNACMCMVVSNMVRFLSGSPEAAACFLEEYLSRYEKAWGFQGIPGFYRYMYSKPRALAYRRLRLLNRAGVKWVSKNMQMSRVEGKSRVKRTRLMARIIVAALPASPYRRNE